MYEWLKKLVSDGNTLKPTFEHFTKMIVDGRHMFDLAANALLAGMAVESVRNDLFETDRKINLAEQKIRREILVHASVRGAQDFPTCLVLMSIAKDAERIGDYCKNIFDLALTRPLDPTGSMGKELMSVKDDVSRLLGHLVTVYTAQDEEGATKILHETDTIEDTCDKHVAELVRDPSQGGAEAVSAALAWRHMKRITAHAKNIVTSIVMPVDKLDFFDEP